MVNKRPVTWQGVGISALKGAITGVAFGAIGKAVSGSMSATTRLANYSKKAIAAERTARVTRMAKRTASIANKYNHIFNKPMHNLSGFLKTFNGNQTRAYSAVQRAINRVKLPNGLFKEVAIKVSGYTIRVSGRVINGVKRIGTFYIK